jgi:cytochrome c-type biogenesis protein CcmH/NrfG
MRGTMEAFQLYITDLAVPLVTSGGKEMYNLPMGRWSFRPAAILPAIAASVCALAQNPPVRAWQDSIQLPTYPEGDPDPNPQFAIYGTDNPNYPYPMRDKPTRERRTTQGWRTLNLENEYLFCRILPDLGGHLYNCRDKRNGREVFYANPVIKKDQVGLRGAWVAMGIESNFPVAHTRDSASPVDFAIQTGPDGSGSAIVKDIDRVTGMEWRIEFVLKPGSAVLEQRVTFYNRAPVRRPYDWWANAGVALDDAGLRFILPSYLVAGHGGVDRRTWPLDSKGVDESIVAGHKGSYNWFAYGSQEPFFAVYKPASRSGLAHFADARVVGGKKLWIWGSDNDGDVQKTLTDNFPSYVEMQGGLFQDQETFHFLEPEEVKSFSESWIPVYDLGGVSRATADAVVNVERVNAGPLRLEMGVTHAIPGATIRLSRQGVPVFEARADLDPAKTYSHSVDNPGAAALTLELLDSHGALLLQHNEGPYNALTVAQVDPKRGAQPDWTHTIETEAFLLARGEYNELTSHMSFAYSDYAKGLKLFPSSVPLQKAAGRAALELDRAEEAAALLGRVFAAVPSDVETAYLLGLAEAMQGRDQEARQALERVPASFEFADAAALQLTAIAARAKDYPGALSSLKPLLIAEPSRPVRPGAIEVALLRRSSQTEQARKSLAEWRALDPADTMLRIENVWLGGEDAALWTHLGADSERVLNFADQYMNLGMWEDALALLAHVYPAVPKDQLEPGAVPPGASPLLAYYRAYCRSRLGQSQAADLRDADLRLASAQSTRYVFPFRSSSFAVLTAAIESNPSDATAHFLLGRLLLSRQMTDDALVEWRKAQALKPPPPELGKELSLLLASLKAASSPAVAAGRAPDLTAILPATPAANTKSPTEIALAALLRAGAGKPLEAAGMFDPKVFAAEKQPNEVRRAYIEVQLQAVMAEARSSPPLSVLAKLDKLGAENTNLAFTFNGFNSFMNGPHFEYFSGLVEADCKDEKASRKRWTKVAKMSAPLGLPEFVYPLLAEARIAPEAAKPKIAAALASVREAETAAKGKAGDATLPALQFSEAMLLHASGQDSEAAAQLEALAHESGDGWVQYLALVGLREVLDGKK